MSKGVVLQCALSLCVYGDLWAQQVYKVVLVNSRAVHAWVGGSGPKTIVLAAGGLALPARRLYVGARLADQAGTPFREGP